MVMYIFTRVLASVYVLSLESICTWKKCCFQKNSKFSHFSFFSPNVEPAKCTQFSTCCIHMFMEVILKGKTGIVANPPALGGTLPHLALFSCTFLQREISPAFSRIPIFSQEICNEQVLKFLVASRIQN